MDRGENMIKAQGLFKNLGYELTETEYSLRYVKQGETEYDDCVIEFWIDEKSFSAIEHYDSKLITIEENKAIQMQLKELSWI